MLKWLRKQMQQMMQQEGLTLIELIVVVAIIAVLAFTITPRVLTALNNSRTNAALSGGNEIHAALERYSVNEATKAAGVLQYPLPSVDTFAALRTAIAGTLGLSNDGDDMFTSFKYVAYSKEAPTLVGDRIDLANPGSNKALSYCIEVAARDNPATTFVIKPSGVDKSTGTCTP